MGRTDGPFGDALSHSAEVVAGVRDARLKVGLEVHIELATRSKMFTRAPNVAHRAYRGAEANTLVDPLVAGLPGALPVMNRRAVEMAVKVGLALNCEIARVSLWDRKSYFYPDLPKGYQISQYDLPLCGAGVVEIAKSGASGGMDVRGEGMKSIRIRRAHLEEDAGQLGHELRRGGRFAGTLVDLNRAGAPLLEIVTEPDFETADEVVGFCRLLRETCRFLEVSECNLEEGQMRFEPNINVMIETAGGECVATPIVEIKNLNSFRSVREAIEYERERQLEEWVRTGQAGGAGEKTTRGWDAACAVTFLQRGKEEAEDYRYFPEPDLIAVAVDAEWEASIRDAIPELPGARRARYVGALGLTAAQAQQLIDEPGRAFFFDDCYEAICCGVGDGGKGGEAEGGRLSKKEAAKYAVNFVLQYGGRLARERACSVSELGITPRQVGQIVALREEGRISVGSAAKLFGLLLDRDEDAAEVAEDCGFFMVVDDDALSAWVDEAIVSNADAVMAIRSGKKNAVSVLVGSVMKASKGRADARAASAMILERLKG